MSNNFSPLNTVKFKIQNMLEKFQLFQSLFSRNFVDRKKEELFSFTSFVLKQTHKNSYYQ